MPRPGIYNNKSLCVVILELCDEPHKGPKSKIKQHFGVSAWGLKIMENQKCEPIPPCLKIRDFEVTRCC